VTRLALVAALVAAAAWIAYAGAWRHGGARPLAYRLVTLRHAEPAHPASRVTTNGSQERVFIASGPRSTTGYRLDVVKAVVERSRVLIVVREREQPGRARVSYPYRLLVFGKVDKPVKVHWEGRP
jgi:hypothetical protein